MTDKPEQELPSSDKEFTVADAVPTTNPPPTSTSKTTVTEAQPQVADPGTTTGSNVAPDAIAPDDDLDTDSAFGDDAQSDTTSLASSIARGYIENGRKYQTTRAVEYWGPSDQKQFETFELGHLLYYILDSGEPNPLFHSPIGHNPQHILDIGTGEGTWAIEVADAFPSATIHGLDLYPLPATWVPPNCIFQVDDVTQDWTWHHKFDLIHMRLLLGAFNDDKRDAVYKSSYDNLIPGGWIEEVELDVRVMSDDGSLDPDSILAGWGPNFPGCAERAGRRLDTQLTMKASIEKVGFVNVQEKLYKYPIGTWPKIKCTRMLEGLIWNVGSRY